MSILASATCLLNVFRLSFSLPANLFPKGYLRLSDIGLYLKFAQHAIVDDFQMQFTHPSNDGLRSLFIRLHPEGGIFLRQLLKREPHLLLILLGFWFNCHCDDRLRELHNLE